MLIHGKRISCGFAGGCLNSTPSKAGVQNKLHAATGEIVLAEERVERADGSMEYRRISVGEEPLQETAAVTESQSVESAESDESLSEAEIQELFALARQYLVDPEKLIEAVERRDDSPWSNLKVYEQEEWETLMTERYGDAWKEW